MKHYIFRSTDDVKAIVPCAAVSVIHLGDEIHICPLGEDKVFDDVTDLVIVDTVEEALGWLLED